MNNNLLRHLSLILFTPIVFLFGDGIAPGRPSVYAIEPYNFPGPGYLGDHSIYLKQATACEVGQWQMEDRDFFIQDNDPGGNPLQGLRVSTFKQRLQSGDWGIVWIHTHGSSTGWIGIEPYTNENACDNAIWDYLAQGYQVDEIAKMGNGPWSICISTIAVNRWFGQSSCLDYSLVFCKSCYTNQFCPHWGARFALGYEGVIAGPAGCDIFWQRMNGKEGKDKRLSLSAMQGIAQLVSFGPNMALAPCVWSQQFGAQETSGDILFQIVMNEDISPYHILSVTNATLSNAYWVDWAAEVSEIHFEITNVTSNTQYYTIDADSARALTLVWNPPWQPYAQHLDGNQFPVGSDGEGPNQDDYKFIGHAQTGIEDTESAFESGFTTCLKTLSPNPGYGKIDINYQIANPTATKITIFDCSGRIVKSIKINDDPGNHSVIWDGVDTQGREVTNGCYFVKFEANDYKIIKKLILIK